MDTNKNTVKLPTPFQMRSGMIPVGVSPSGVEWNCWRLFDESVTTWASRAEMQRSRLATLWAKHDAKLVKVRFLTGAQAYRIADEASCVEGQGKVKAEGATFILAPRGLLQAVADRLEGYSVEDLSDGGYAVTPEQVAFADRATERHIKSTIAKIREALRKA